MQATVSYHQVLKIVLAMFHFYWTELTFLQNGLSLSEFCVTRTKQYIINLFKWAINFWWQQRCLYFANYSLLQCIHKLCLSFKFVWFGSLQCEFCHFTDIFITLLFNNSWATAPFNLWPLNYCLKQRSHHFGGDPDQESGYGSRHW